MNINAAIVKVFVDENGHYGNPVGIIIDIKNIISSQKRLEITQKLGFSETVFINNLDSINVSIYNPQEEVNFAGHALLGTAWYIITKIGNQLASIKTQKSESFIEVKGPFIYLTANSNALPPWNYLQLDSPNDVINLTSTNIQKYEHTYVWAWTDKEQGKIRARTFAPDWGIPEDEANGSGSMKLSLQLERRLEITHGKGSVIFAENLDLTTCKIGGRVSFLDQEMARV